LLPGEIVFMFKYNSFFVSMQKVTSGFLDPSIDGSRNEKNFLHSCPDSNRGRNPLRFKYCSIVSNIVEKTETKIRALYFEK